VAPRYLVPSLVLLALAGCGKTTIDQGRAESFVRSYFTPDARTADCPDGVEARAGARLECSVVAADGQSFRVTAHVVDSDGRLRISSADVRPEG
jgi:hypothetical protein